LRPALIFVAAAAFVLAGFTFAGSAIGVWDPVVRQDRGSHAHLIGDRHDSDAVSRATPAVVTSKPNPPISVQLALLIALGSSALLVLPSRGLRVARHLGDLAGPQTLAGPALPGRFRRRLGQRATAKPAIGPNAPVVRPERARLRRRLSILGVAALPGRILRRPGRRPTVKPSLAPVARVVHPERARSRRSFSTPLRERSFRALHEFYADAVILTLAVGSALAIGLLIGRLLAGP
jgi:hypothetical protein